MSTEATQGMGADVADLESMFNDEPGDTALEQGAQSQTGDGTQTQQSDSNAVEVDDNGNPLEAVTVEVDADGNEVVIEAEDQTGEPTAELVIPNDHKVKLTIDGEETEKSFGELIANAQKYEAANKRFEEAAAIRKEYTDKAQNLHTREGQLGQVLEYYIAQSQQFFQQEPNWAELIQNDPQKYLTERHNWETRQAQLNQARQVQANLQRQQAEQQAASAQQRVEEAKQKLQKAIPEWADPKKAAEGAVTIDRYLHEQGIAPEMRAAIDSAEVLLIARKAMLYDQAVAAAKARKAGGQQQAASAAQQPTNAQPQRQVRQQSKVERPGAATSAQTAASRQNLTRANAAKAFAANPSVDTLANFFE